MMSVDRLQQLLDELAERLHRSIAIDDVQISLIGSSRHYGDEDPVRVRSLVSRKPDQQAIDFILTQGIMSLHKPSWIDGNDSLELAPRLCVPLRADGELMGFMWLIDDHSLTGVELVIINEAAATIARMLKTRVDAGRDELAEHQTLVHNLLTGDQLAHEQAVADIRELDLLAGAKYFTVFVVVVELDSTNEQRLPAPTRSHAEHRMPEITRAVARVGTSESAGRCLTAGVDRGAIVLFGTTDKPTATRMAVLAERMRKELDIAGIAGKRRHGRIGIGDPQPSLGRARISYEQASCALRVAHVRVVDEPVAWSHSGIDGLLAAIAPERLTVGLLPPELVLLDEKVSVDSAYTLMRYLDYAGNVQLAADSLNIHRSTVYYRLSQIEKALDVSLEDGQIRLLLHTWLKLRPYIGRAGFSKLT